MEYDSGDYPACQAEALAKIGWDTFRVRQAEARAKGRHLGIGLAHGVKGSGRGPFESGVVRISRTGKVTVFNGASAMGQGLGTALAQITASHLGVDVGNVKVIAGDTSGVSLGLGGFASRQTVTAGSSVHLAAKAVANKAKKVASHVLEADENDLELAGGEVRVAGAPQLNVKLSEIARILQGAPGYGFPAGVDPGLEANVNYRTDSLAYANGCHACEVEVDAETGEVKILRYVAMQDSGILINPMMVEGQIHGGVAHGIGNALYEWMGYDDAAQPVTTTFADYLLPTATEVPMFDTLYKETRSPLNPLGVKGVGEAGTIPAAAALISAVEDALSPFNVRIGQMPLSPMKIVELIRAARTSGG
jgi:carbon-monoxide dehydrogenase large subunit